MIFAYVTQPLDFVSALPAITEATMICLNLFAEYDI
jgi:hypothetical protein